MDAFRLAHVARDSGELCDFGGNHDVGPDLNIVIVDFLYDVVFYIVQDEAELDDVGIWLTGSRLGQETRCFDVEDE